MDGSPLRVHRNPCGLIFQRLKVLSLEEAFECLEGVGTAFADQADHSSHWRIGYQPVEVRRIGGDEPYAANIGWHTLGQTHSRLHQGHRALSWPARNSSHSADSSVSPDQCTDLDLFRSSIAASLQSH